MRKTVAMILALAALSLAPFSSQAASCDLIGAPESLWDYDGKIVRLPAMTVLVVTRFQRRQGPKHSPEERELWTDDVPSEVIGNARICDRMQLESPLPLNGPEALPLTMQQGERLDPSVDLQTIDPQFAARLQAEDRIVRVEQRRYYVRVIEDQQNPNWRQDLLTEASNQGQIDPNGWIIGMAGALYIVPLRPES